MSVPPVLPPEQVPTLVDEKGRFWSIDRILEQLPRIRTEEVRAELRVQAERLLQTGVRFDHLDYHEGILAMYGPFFEAVKELAREHGVPVRQPAPESVFGHLKWPGRAGGGAVTIRKMVAFAARHPVLAWRLMPHVSPSAFRARAAALQADGIAAPDRGWPNGTHPFGLPGSSQAQLGGRRRTGPHPNNPRARSPDPIRTRPALRLHPHPAQRRGNL